MKGWLVVNSFLIGDKYTEIYNYLLNSAKAEGVELELIYSQTLMQTVEAGFSNFDLPDFVIFWDKDIYLAKRLELAGLRLFNCASAIEVCDNKALTAIALMGKVATPKTMIAPKTFENINYSSNEFLKTATDVLGFPVIVKEVYGSFGKQVYLAKSMAELETIVASLKSKDFIMQEFIAESYGRDIRINVVGDKVVSQMLRKSETDFRSNVSSGATTSLVELTSEQANIALKAVKTLGLDFAGVDVLFGKDGPLVCEVNSNLHFASSYNCNGVDVSRLILKYIKEQIKC